MNKELTSVIAILALATAGCGSKSPTCRGPVGEDIPLEECSSSNHSVYVTTPMTVISHKDK